MTSQVFVRDVRMLQDFEAQLAQFGQVSGEVLAGVGRSIEKCAMHLEERRTHWAGVLRRRERDLRACRSDKDASCGGLEAAILEAEQALQAIGRLQVRLEQAVGEHRPYASRMAAVAGERIQKARLDVRSSIQKYESYLQNEGLGIASGGPTQSDFGQSFSGLSAAEKGTWGEKAVVKEAKQAGHDVIIAHPEKPTLGGFDCVSMDWDANRLHIWEAKNIGGGYVSERNLTAWKDNVDKYTTYWRDLVETLPEGPQRDAAMRAVNSGRVTFHLRLGPESNISASLGDKLNSANVPGADYDWFQYSSEFMMSILDSEL